jgi:hypothetical protein
MAKSCGRFGDSMILKMGSFRVNETPGRVASLRLGAGGFTGHHFAISAL